MKVIFFLSRPIGAVFGMACLHHNDDDDDDDNNNVRNMLCYVPHFFFFVQHPRKVCIANRNIGQKFVFLKNKYISVILAFVVCSIKLVTSAVGISLPLIFCI